mmetsp:Transcript_29262/g.52929  ORF Transcript_29262/g.52929 Transcript_29262/m.52929 type:complete len:149 (+) Transcript_29262:81-527(+)
MPSTEAIKLIRSTKGNLTITASDEASFISAPTGQGGNNALPKTSKTTPSPAEKTQKSSSMFAAPESSSVKSAVSTSAMASSNHNHGTRGRTAEEIERHKRLVGYSRIVAPLTAIWFELFATLGGFLCFVLGIIFVILQIIICCRMCAI